MMAFRMNVIPFPRATEPEPLAFAMGARIDLRVGATAAGVVRPRGPAQEAFAYSNLARLLRAARMTWRERAQYAALTLVVAEDIHRDIDPELLSEAAIESGCTRRQFSFELSERQIIAHGAALAEDLRARGWGISLRGDPECPLPFGARARALYGEVVLPAPETPGPYLALEGGDATPLGRRLIAAKAAGIILSAEGVRSASHAKRLAIAGFDRGSGPFAEASLR
jgi:hypothetical protein